jgi:glyceraldehyde 3-phosphate dehydrogenase/D-erythrose 4-phosphate dehydrogenase
MSQRRLRIAINGYGRIGRCLLRALRESPLRTRIEIVAINEPADLESIAYLTRFDSTHGRFPSTVEIVGGDLCIDGECIRVSHAATPDGVDWPGLGIDMVVECSGRYARRHELEAFLAAGCPRLLLSHPGHDAADVDRTVILATNGETLDGSERLVSAASCTTNAAVPVLALIDANFGLDHVLLTTLHSVMNDQPLIDAHHTSDLRRSRSAMQSMIPVATGLARGVERLLPELAGRVVAKSVRVPVPNVSAIDLVASLRRPADAAEINLLLHRAASAEFSGQLACSDDPHASIDFNHSPQSAIVDTTQTRMSGDKLANLLIWFDNEWGFANRMLELADHWGRRAGC